MSPDLLTIRQQSQQSRPRRSPPRSDPSVTISRNRSIVMSTPLPTTRYSHHATCNGENILCYTKNRRYLELPTIDLRKRYWKVWVHKPVLVGGTTFGTNTRGVKGQWLDESSVTKPDSRSENVSKTRSMTASASVWISREASMADSTRMSISASTMPWCNSASRWVRPK